MQKGDFFQRYKGTFFKMNAKKRYGIVIKINTNRDTKNANRRFFKDKKLTFFKINKKCGFFQDKRDLFQHEYKKISYQDECKKIGISFQDNFFFSR